jgi:hypothetical protein
MSKISKYIKLDKNILLEYIYNDSNLISEPYSILVNSKYKTNAYMAGPSSITGNDINNQLFKLDTISGRYGKVSYSPNQTPGIISNNYSFLQVKDYTSGNPLRHDTLKIHLPINWTFGEYLGFYIKVYAHDYTNSKIYDLSNFYFDMTSIEQQYLLNFTSPPLLFQEKLWGKNITVEIPALSELSSQILDGKPRENSINYNLTDNIGLSSTAPIFIDFHFITNIQTINSVTSYLLSANNTVSIPQAPEFERLGLVIQHSPNGDFFEIYGVYNDTIFGFKKFIDDSFTLDRNYYVQYDITLYEQNIRGKTTTITVTDNFNETIEYRPIIKYSSTTAIIDVEMRLIDSVDDSTIIRRASYGMLQDELSKYAINMMKINVKNVSKPKIYNIKSSINTTLIGGLGNVNGSLVLGNTGTGVPGNGMNNGNGNGQGLNNLSSQNGVVIETIKVPFPVLVDRFNIIAKSDNALFNNTMFYGFGRIQILLYPFDNVIKFSIATGPENKPDYFNMTSISEISFVIKNDQNQITFPLFTESGDINLAIGQVVFKVNQNRFAEIKKIYDGGINIFYITGKSQSTTSVIYTGLFKIYDSRSNVNALNDQAANMQANNPSIILDPNTTKETAIVTRKLINEQAPIIKPGATS